MARDKRYLISFDGENFYLRGVVAVKEDAVRGEKIYFCDRHLGGPFKSISAAAQRARRRNYPTNMGDRS